MGLWKRYYEYPRGSKERKMLENFFNPQETSYSGVYMYAGRSKKIKKGRVTVIEEKGDQVQVCDVDGNTALVAKSTLQSTMDL
jgi:SH3-like domain-containing protein